MTDLEKWKAFLGEFQIAFTEDQGQRPNGFGAAEDQTVQELEITGASFLMGVLIEFDMSGRFISIGGT